MTTYPSIHIEGGLIPADIIDLVSSANINGQQPTDFGTDGRLSDEIAAAWAAARAYWNAFQRALGQLDESEAGTTETHDQLIAPLLLSLGYDGLVFERRGLPVCIFTHFGSSSSAISDEKLHCYIALTKRKTTLSS